MITLISECEKKALLRTRSRGELLWIVGNRNKFNDEVCVAVNWTEKELFMDIKNNKHNSAYAIAVRYFYK